MNQDDGSFQWRRELIKSQDETKSDNDKRRKPFRAKRSKVFKDDFSKKLDFNWRTGSCKHKVTFEGSENIRRLRFVNDSIAFGLLDGRVCVTDISTGSFARLQSQNYLLPNFQFYIYIPSFSYSSQYKSAYLLITLVLSIKLTSSSTFYFCSYLTTPYVTKFQFST